MCTSLRMCMCQAPEDISRSVCFLGRWVARGLHQYPWFRCQLGAQALARRLPHARMFCTYSLPLLSSSFSLCSFCVTSALATVQPSLEGFLIKRPKSDSHPPNQAQLEILSPTGHWGVSSFLGGQGPTFQASLFLSPDSRLTLCWLAHLLRIGQPSGTI